MAKKSNKARKAYWRNGDICKKTSNNIYEFHKESSSIVKYDENDSKYIKSKEELIKLFNQNEEEFKPVLEAVKSKFNY